MSAPAAPARPLGVNEVVNGTAACWQLRCDSGRVGFGLLGCQATMRLVSAVEVRLCHRLKAALPVTTPEVAAAPFRDIQGASPQRTLRSGRSRPPFAAIQRGPAPFCHPTFVLDAAKVATRSSRRSFNPEAYRPIRRVPQAALSAREGYPSLEEPSPGNGRELPVRT
jgi:hypothetical protein